MIARNKRLLNSVAQFWSCSQQKLAYMRAAPADTLPECFGFARLFHRALAHRGYKCVNDIRRRLRENFFHCSVLFSRLRGLLRGCLRALEKVVDIERRVVCSVVHTQRMEEKQGQEMLMNICTRQVCESHD